MRESFHATLCKVLLILINLYVQKKDVLEALQVFISDSEKFSPRSISFKKNTYGIRTKSKLL
jgi:hypothetical protein